MPVGSRVAPEEALARVQSALGDKASNMKLNFEQVRLRVPSGRTSSRSLRSSVTTPN